MSGNIAVTGIPTTPGANGAVPLRRELRDLQRNFPDQYNLLILGLKNLEGQSETGLTSYYQLAGIHGLPFKPWNGVGSTTNWQTSTGFGGYCTHSSILFLPWHRPYLALYEQSLYNAVQAVAAQFPQGALRDRYVQAAKTFRAPYFDWASQPPQGTSAFPSAFTTPNVTVVDVDGTTKSTANPLYRFAFHPVNPSQGDFPAQWSRYQTTVRYPNRSGQSQDARVGPILSNELASLRSNVGLLLLSYTKYDAFSFNQWDTNTNPGDFGSIEDLHNEIHDRAGGGGHMSSLEVSAFDPLFWLHHINVDRLWAIWQELNPNSDMTPHPAPYSTFSATGGQSQTKDTPLAPFWDKSGTKFWTSAQIKSTLTFGYAYPETQKWLSADTQAYQANIRQAVTSLYGTNVFTNFVANVAQRKDEHAIAVSALAAQPKADLAKTESVKTESVNTDAVKAHAVKTDAVKADAVKVDAVKADVVKTEAIVVRHSVKADVVKTDVVVVVHGVEAEDAPVEKAAAPAHDKPAFAVSQTVFAAREPAAKPVVPAKKDGPIPASLKHLAPNNTYTEWVVNVRAQKHGLGSSFRTLVFLGAFDESNPASWDTEFNCVGRVSVLGRDPAETQCDKCRSDAAGELMVSGTVPLTSALLQDIVEGEVASLDAAVVVPHLKEKLKWKVTLFNGEERNAAEVPGLKVSVASTKVTIGEDGLPHYSHEYTVWPDVTDGKPAGLGAGEHV